MLARRVAMSAATAFLAVNLLTGAPLLALWVGSRVVGQKQATFQAVAVVAREAERGALYDLFAAAYPQADGYQAQTSRQIPVVILTRR